MSKYRATLCGNIIGPRGKLLKLIPKRNGYLHFSLSYKQTLVHRFVYEYFRESIPDGLVINHIDGNRHNNSIHNLEVTTYRDNAMKGKGSKLSYEDVDKIRDMLGKYSGRYIADTFHISSQLVSDIKYNRRHVKN